MSNKKGIHVCFLAFLPAPGFYTLNKALNPAPCHEVTSGDLFGTLDHFKGNYLYRYAGALNRYLINSPMLRGLKRDNDGGLPLYIHKATANGTCRC